MPSPVAHVGLAFAVYAAVRPPGRATRRVDLAVIALAAVLPDFDLLPDLLGGEGIRWHHGATHSLVGAALLAGAMMTLVRPPAATAIAIVAALVMHAPLDYTTGEPGAPEKYGVEWLWPLSSRRFISPEPYFGAYHIDREGGLVHMFVGEALPCYLREALTAGAALVAGLAVGAARATWARRTRSPDP